MHEAGQPERRVQQGLLEQLLLVLMVLHEQGLPLAQARRWASRGGIKGGQHGKKSVAPPFCKEGGREGRARKGGRGWLTHGLTDLGCWTGLGGPSPRSPSCGCRCWRCWPSWSWLAAAGRPAAAAAWRRRRRWRPAWPPSPCEALLPHPHLPLEQPRPLLARAGKTMTMSMLRRAERRSRGCCWGWAGRRRRGGPRAAGSRPRTTGRCLPPTPPETGAAGGSQRTSLTQQHRSSSAA